MKRCPVTEVPAAPASVALVHFQAELAFETDCADVHDAMLGGDVRFVLLDVRAPDAFNAGHVPGAINLPHRKIIPSSLERFPFDTFFVVYCDGPHCNAATKAAIRIAGLGRAVKKMAGGIMGWRLDGFSLESGCVGS